MRSIDQHSLVTQAIEVHAGYHALGNKIVETEHARFVVSRETPRIYDSNVATRPRAHSDAEIDAFFTTTDEVLAHCGHRHVFVDLDTPPRLEARLALAGYELDHWVQLVLRGELALEPPRADIRPVETEADWDAFRRLLRLDHVEEATHGHRGALDVAVTDQMVACKRAKAPEVQFFLARHGNEDVAFFSSWPGCDGLGVVEDLFCHPDHRRLGIAGALVTHCVADARARGADQLLIAADPDDWPKGFYHRIGFEPLAEFRAWVVRGVQS